MSQIQEPTMPAYPRGEDILMYNMWAATHGRPRWGAPEAPEPLPKAAPKRRGRPGLPVPAPPSHGAMPDLSLIHI